MKLTANNEAESRDAETRRRICEELEQNFLVEAAAGTGKTTSIVNRLVSLVVAGVCPIEKLVAVTFTRKAAAELRERFQAELRRRAANCDVAVTPAEQAARERLRHACDNSSRAFVGTIHSFCAALLRERPIEFGIDPAFRELDEQEDFELREQAWQENINDLLAVGDPLIDKLSELGIDRQLIKKRFDRFIEYRDVDLWPSAIPRDIDIDQLQRKTREYIDEMLQLLPHFPVARGNDKLMARYETIVRASTKDWKRLGNFFSLLEKFDTSASAVQSQWHDKTIGKIEKQRWEQFRESVAKPGMQYWCRVRYGFVVDFLRRAVMVYERLKATTNGLDFNDLLLTASRGLKSQPELRKYFQTRYTHLLVDEFQDTDPTQAELILYLCAADIHEPQWDKCMLRAGSLFLVGDPKQSIYRFRRGDIVTYNRVKEVFQSSGGEVLALVKNFRSRTELREWNNQVFRNKFLPQADQYTPAAEDMLQGRVDAQAGELCGVFTLTVDSELNIDEATEQEADAIARFIRHAIDAGLTVSRTQRELNLGRTGAVEARDFLIIPRSKRRISLFKAALDMYGIPCEVTGTNAFLGIQELSVLIDCLRAVDDPHNPVHLLAVLRERLFGFSDQELYLFKQSGGRFAFTVPVPDELNETLWNRELKSRFENAMGRLKRYQAWLRALPFAVAVHRVAEDLGLLASAAAGREGNVTAGGFMKAIDWLRQQTFDFDSASDLINFLEQSQAGDENEGCSALSPDANVVRVMNLHKAKGLEAPVVFLADTAKKAEFPVLSHIDRSGPISAGYMGITADKGPWARDKLEIATPENWKHFQQEEQRFLDAEADRLLYVATTRAACALVVSVGKDSSNWSDLHPFLMNSTELEIPAQQKLRAAKNRITSKSTRKLPSLTREQLSAKWTTAAQPGYTIVTAKELGLSGTRRPSWETSGDYGFKWGSAIHQLLEICSKSPEANLRSTATTLTREFDLGSDRIDELLTTVKAVTHSDIWQRSQVAIRCFSEIPYETSAIDTEGKAMIVRGVIDLIFEEPQGWVIVDYKTDDFPEPEFDKAVAYYRRQLEIYAEHWFRSVGENVKELGLYFTRFDRYVAMYNGTAPL